MLENRYKQNVYQELTYFSLVCNTEIRNVETSEKFNSVFIYLRYLHLLSQFHKPVQRLKINLYSN